MTPVASGLNYQPKPIKSSAMGVPAKSPSTNVAAASNAIPIGQAQTQNMSSTTPALGGNQTPNWGGSTGYTTPTTSPTTTSPVTQTSSAGTTSTPPVTNPPNHASLVQQGADLGLYGSPQYQAAQEELKRYQNSYANANAGLGQGGTDFGYLQGTETNLGNQYQQGLASRQQALQNSLTEQGQRIGAVQTAAGQSAPTTQFGVLTSPFTAQPIGGGTPQSAAFQGGQIANSQALGGQYQSNQVAIKGAQSLGQQFLSQVAAVPDFNSSSANFGNYINQLLQNNYSNPAFPGIQSTFNNIINAYASVLPGGKDQVVNLIKSANPTSMQALISSLDSQAQAVNQANLTVGTGGGQNNSGNYTGPTININGTVLPTSF